MKVAIILLAVIACAWASGQGLRRGPHGLSAPYRNADRQHAVNKVAEHIGAGTGTAKYYGVPGANYGYYGHPYYGHHGGFYGYPGNFHGYGAHGYNGYNGYPYGYLGF